MPKTLDMLRKVQGGELPPPPVPTLIGLTIGSIILGVLLGGQLIGDRVSHMLLTFDMPMVDTGIDTAPEAAIASLVGLYVLAALFNLRIPRTSAPLQPFAHSFLGRVTAGRAELQIWNVGDVVPVFFAVENIDVIVLHALSPNLAAIVQAAHTSPPPPSPTSTRPRRHSQSRPRTPLPRPPEKSPRFLASPASGRRERFEPASCRGLLVPPAWHLQETVHANGY